MLVSEILMAPAATSPSSCKTTTKTTGYNYFFAYDGKPPSTESILGLLSKEKVLALQATKGRAVPQ